MSGFLWLVLSWKWEQKLRKLSGIDQVLAIWLVCIVTVVVWLPVLSLRRAACIPQVSLTEAVCQGWLLQVVGQSSSFINGLAIVCLYIQSLMTDTNETRWSH